MSLQACVPVLLLLVVFPSEATRNVSAEVEEGRLLVRGKPVLVYPLTAPSRHQLIVGIGVPVQELLHSVVFGWVLKAQYYLPSKPGDYEPVNLDNWNDSRRAFPEPRARRAVERYEVDNVSIRVEPLLPSEPSKQPDDGFEDDLLMDDDDELIEEDESKATDADSKASEAGEGTSGTPETVYSAEHSRWSVYRAIETLSEGYGLGGRPCMLRTICEAADAQFTHTGGVFAELLHIILSPSSTNESTSDHRDNEYFRAEHLGRSGAPCATIFRECSTSLLDMFSGIHDYPFRTGASSFGVPQPVSLYPAMR
ncbi:uncharacterized protein LOC118457586 [Anopheles albimanus]|uniref:uncharacterized protein LOC118457586 n=1 Tax=Anopheles albimanus TaxID=7167 RepID=UPI0016421D7B|nr:uncharacterized protein LOC118457586 [Anopheles albimanus]